MSPTQSTSVEALLGKTIDKNRLQFVSVLGLGAYGVVYLAKDISADIGASSATDPSSPYSGSGYFAVKCLNKIGLDSRQISFQRREIALHTLASSHPNVVSLHRVVETSSVIYVILAYCPDGDLFGMITEQSRYLGNDALIKKVFLQIIDSVEYCHRLGIYHRDLKPENILCCDGGETVMLADFGLATSEKTSLDFGCGSTFYMSPECQGGVFQTLGSYSTLHNDIWSLGVILVNLTCGRNPWKQACPSDETFRAYLDNPDFLRSILPISTPCNDLLKRIFSLNPMARISLAELRDTVVKMPRWTMTEAELSRATRATREAARAFVKAVDQLSPRFDGDSQQSDGRSLPESASQAYPSSIASTSDASSAAYSFASSISFPDCLSSRAAPPQSPTPAERAAANDRKASPQRHSRPLPPLPVNDRPIRKNKSNGSSKRKILGSPVQLGNCPSNAPRIDTLTIDVPISMMDVDTPLFSPATSVTPPTPRLNYPSTPKAQSRANMPSRSRSPPSSSSSSSSSDDSWSDQPRTPNTPIFANLAGSEADAQLIIEKGNSVTSIASSQASFENYYSRYASWAADDTTDVIMCDSSSNFPKSACSPSVQQAAQAYQRGIAAEQQRVAARVDSNLLTAAALAAANQAYATLLPQEKSPAVGQAVTIQTVRV